MRDDLPTAVVDPVAGNNNSTESMTVGSADSDGDGVPDASDCSPGDGTLWAVPSEATDLIFPNAADPALLQWRAPSSPGGTVVRYDLLRSAVPASFSSAVCLAADITSTTATDLTPPTAILYFLVRSENPCGGNLGTRSDGAPRTAGSCP